MDTNRNRPESLSYYEGVERFNFYTKKICSFNSIKWPRLYIHYVNLEVHSTSENQNLCHQQF